MLRLLRFLAPNLVTAVGLMFGLLSMVATFEHRFVDAGWLIIWAVMLDRIDGFVARSLNATSPFGIQMDSFADAINFGVAPAMLVYVSLGSAPPLGFTHGFGRALLIGACAAWVLANVFRLARFNVVAEAPQPPPVFFGVPTTLAAGVLVIWTLTLHKYAASGALLGQAGGFRGPKLYGDWTVDLGAWSYLPAAMLLGAFLMASNLPQPKLRLAKHRGLGGVFLAASGSGLVCAFTRFMPDYMALLPSTWLLGSLAWGQLSARARDYRPPSFLPLEPHEVAYASERRSPVAEESSR